MVPTGARQKTGPAGCSKSWTSHPPNPSAPRRALSLAMPQRAKRQEGTNPTSCGPFAPGVGPGERKTPSSAPIYEEFLINVEPLSDARTPLAGFFSILLSCEELLGIGRRETTELSAVAGAIQDCHLQTLQ